MPDTITNVHTFDQPIETSVKVGMEIDSKGQKKPNVEIKVTRKLGIADGKQAVLFIEDDLKAALLRCKDTIKKSMEE